MNVDMLRRVAEHIRRNPNEYNQSRWLNDDWHLPGCGTVACVAGHAVLASGRTPAELHRLIEMGTVGDVACEIFGIDLGRWSDGCRLFFANPAEDWPPKWARRWKDALQATLNDLAQDALARPDTARQAAVAADLLDALANGDVTLDDYGYLHEVAR